MNKGKKVIPASPEEGPSSANLYAQGTGGEEGEGAFTGEYLVRGMMDLLQALLKGDEDFNAIMKGVHSAAIVPAQVPCGTCLHVQWPDLLYKLYLFMHNAYY